jgi:hypothetical protein
MPSLHSKIHGVGVLWLGLVQNLIEDSDFFTLLLVNKSNDPS